MFLSLWRELLFAAIIIEDKLRLRVLLSVWDIFSNSISIFNLFNPLLIMHPLIIFLDTAKLLPGSISVIIGATVTYFLS